jgi:hypothetical protein
VLSQTGARSPRHIGRSEVSNRTQAKLATNLFFRVEIVLQSVGSQH